MAEAGATGWLEIAASVEHLKFTMFPSAYRYTEGRGMGMGMGIGTECHQPLLDAGRRADM